jgi:AcrR family transcriptional regulator
MSIEVAFVEGLVKVRNSADPEGPVLVFTAVEWATFQRAVRDGDFDLLEGKATVDDAGDDEFDPDRPMADRIRRAFQSVAPTISAKELIERAEGEERAQRQGHRWGDTGASSPRRARPRERILDAATRLFADEGINAISVDRVIAEADVAPMTVYRNFAGKDDLVTATLKRWSEQWLGWLRSEAARGGDDPRTRLDGLWDALEKWFADEGFRGSYVANAASELRSRPSHPAQRVIAEHQQAFRRLLEDLVQGSDAGEATVLAAELQVLVDGAIAAAAAWGDPSAARGLRTLATDAVAAGR